VSGWNTKEVVGDINSNARMVETPKLFTSNALSAGCLLTSHAAMTDANLIWFAGG
jgi:hypothetical protein